MKVEAGQLRVWDDVISLDKTPFLVIEQVIYPDAAASPPVWEQDDWQILCEGKLSIYDASAIETFSDVLDESR